MWWEYSSKAVHWRLRLWEDLTVECWGTWVVSLLPLLAWAKQTPLATERVLQCIQLLFLPEKEIVWNHLNPLYILKQPAFSPHMVQHMACWKKSTFSVSRHTIYTRLPGFLVSSSCKHRKNKPLNFSSKSEALETQWMNAFNLQPLPRPLASTIKRTCCSFPSWIT